RMQRVWRREDGEAEWLVYDAQKLVAEARTGGLERYYLSEGGSVYSPLVSQLGSQHWFLFDALGTTLGLTDGSGGLSDAFLYEAFGTSLGRTGTTETPYQYVGGYGYFREAAVGLEQVWWRWSNPGDGRWLSEDMLRTGAGNYGYVGNAPSAFVDPRGLASWIKDAWWDITHPADIIRELPQADIEVAKSGYFNCFMRCKVPFGNTGIMKRLIDSLTEAPQGGYAPPDLWGDVASVVPDTSVDLLERYYRNRHRYIRGRLSNMWDLPTPTWEGIVPELKTAEGYARSMGDVLGAAGSAADIAETYLCWSKCKCLLQY
ncbi:MAG: RHS repeat-associated core domain-containing protein, partial [Armatimonadia bacterium]